MPRLSLIIFLLSCFVFNYAQTREIDSLQSVLKTAKEDTNKVNALRRIGLLKHYNVGNYDSALVFYNQSLLLAQKLNYKKGIANGNNNIGMVYDIQGNYPQAIKQFLSALKTFEEIGSKQGIAFCNANLGKIYSMQGNYTQALKQHLSALKLFEEIGNKHGIAGCNNNIGVVYEKQGNYPQALKQYLSALKIHEEIGNKQGVAMCNNNIGNIYDYQGNYPQALKQYLSALKIHEEIDNKQGVASCNINIGGLNMVLHKPNEAKHYFQKALILAKEIGSKDDISASYSGLERAESALGNYKEALENYKMHITYRDSLFNEENTKQTVQTQMQYEFDKKQLADSLKIADERKLNAVKFEQEKKQRYYLYGGLALVLLFAGFMYNRFKVTQKQKTIIIQQKYIVEEQHKEILDSINYAERIQRSFMASKEVLDENLSDYFIFFKPKDVVSGDFYWANKLPNGNFAIATADSTGHGVPGAIMSLLNITSIEKAIEQNNVLPNEILNHTRNTIIERLKKDGSAEGGKDGMDCSLLVLSPPTSQGGGSYTKLYVAAANNPVWIVRAPSDSPKGGGLSGANPPSGGVGGFEIKPDKMPVGKHDKQNISFTLHEIDLQKGDVIYTLTDGFPDQFGGEQGKKFMVKRLRELLVENAHLPMHEQRQFLEKTFTAWTGRLEQIDDVTVIGIRV